jgi:hypothetical protein
MLAAAFLTRSQTESVSALSLVQDSDTPAWLRAAARDSRRSQLAAAALTNWPSPPCGGLTASSTPQCPLVPRQLERALVESL